MTIDTADPIAAPLVFPFIPAVMAQYYVLAQLVLFTGLLMLVRARLGRPEDAGPAAHRAGPSPPAAAAPLSP